MTETVCIAAALTSLILVTTSTTSLRWSDVPFLAFLVFPYLVLGLMASWQRGRRHRSDLVFVAVLLLSLGGIGLLGFDSIRFHTVPEHRLTQRLTVIIVPMLQSAAALALALVLLGYRMLAGDHSASAELSRRR